MDLARHKTGPGGEKQRRQLLDHLKSGCRNWILSGYMICDSVNRVFFIGASLQYYSAGKLQFPIVPFQGNLNPGAPAMIEQNSLLAVMPLRASSPGDSSSIAARLIEHSVN